MKMHIEKEEKFDGLEKDRHDLDCKLYTEEVEKKKLEIADLEKKIKDIETYFDTYGDY